MAVEIKELVIRAVAVEDHDKKVKTTIGQEFYDTELSQKLVQSCVKKVLSILERKKAR